MNIEYHSFIQNRDVLFCFYFYQEKSPAVGMKDDFGWKEPTMISCVVNYAYGTNLQKKTIRIVYLGISVGDFVATVIQENENNYNSMSKRVLNYFLFFILENVFFATNIFRSIFYTGFWSKVLYLYSSRIEFYNNYFITYGNSCSWLPAKMYVQMYTHACL